MRSKRSNILRDDRGLAAIEFVLIAPILALVLLGIGDGANLLLRYYDMRAAVSSAAQYVMVSGTSADTTTAQSIATSAWNTKDANSSVSVYNACYCGSSTATCNTLCADQSVPLSYTTVTATGLFSGMTYTTNLSDTEVVRVR